MRRQAQGVLALFVVLMAAAAHVPLAAQTNAPAASPAPAQQASPAVKFETVLRDSTYVWTKTKDAEWSTRFSGTASQIVTVYISVVGDLAVVQSAVTLPSLNATQLANLLALNFSLDLVKVSIQDEALIALNESEVRLLDGPALKRIVESVARCANDVPGALDATPVESASPLTLPRSSDRRMTVPVHLEARAGR